jgi:hypothetical protein
MRRFVFFVVLCALSLPVGISITGCSLITNNNGANFCSGFQSGPLVSAVATIDLEPATYGVSLGYGQTYSVSTPTAKNCKNQSVTVSNYTYAITPKPSGNVYLADVSPTGRVCGGSWNRNSGNGIPDFTTCVPPPPGSAIYQAGGGVAYITASGGNATSNPVAVYVHPPVTSVVLGNLGNSPGCVSQNQTSALTGKVFSGTTDITANAGHLVYSAQNPSIVTIDQNGNATANQPGSTVVSATVAQATSAAGYFFTCPPASIQLRVGNTDQTSVTVNTNNIQPLTATVLDTQKNVITGLTLTYSSNDPINIPVSQSGAVTPVFPGDAAITAQCLPGICNPAPQDQIGNLSTGQPITSNPVQVLTPGPSLNILYMASPQSYNFVPVDFQSGTVGTPIRLPYQPNSMVMDELGNHLFFGSAHENMIVSISATAGASLTVEAPGVPGTVLAVSPDDTLVAIHDPCRQLFYLYTPALGKQAATELSFGAPGPTVACDVNNQPLDPSVEVNPPYSAAFTQDSQTLYIVGNGTLYTYSKFTGWHTCTDNGQTGNCPLGPTGVAVTIPGVGAFAGGPTTTAFGYCAIGPNNSGAQNPGPPPTGINPNSALNPTAYYPLAETVGATTDQLAATTDGFHIIGAAAAGQLTDIEPTIPSGACPLNGPLVFTSKFSQYSLANPGTNPIDQVLVSPNSQLAFVTFAPKNSTTGSSTLPAYQIPCAPPNQTSCPAGQATTGKVVNVPLTGQAGVPIGGTFSPDGNTFYISTSGDDLVHFISTSNINALADTQNINPGLTCGVTTTATANPFLDCTQGKPVPALFLASRPRPTQGALTSSARN